MVQVGLVFGSARHGSVGLGWSGLVAFNSMVWCRTLAAVKGPQRKKKLYPWAPHRLTARSSLQQHATHLSTPTCHPSPLPKPISSRHPPPHPPRSPLKQKKPAACSWPHPRVGVKVLGTTLKTTAVKKSPRGVSEGKLPIKTDDCKQRSLRGLGGVIQMISVLVTHQQETLTSTLRQLHNHVVKPSSFTLKPRLLLTGYHCCGQKCNDRWIFVFMCKRSLNFRP